MRCRRWHQRNTDSCFVANRYLNHASTFLPGGTDSGTYHAIDFGKGHAALISGEESGLQASQKTLIDRKTGHAKTF
jgi:hypothetical protein